MRALRLFLIVSPCAFLASCSAIETLSFQPAGNSGMKEAQRVVVSYIAKDRTEETCKQDGAGCFDFAGRGIDPTIAALCRSKPGPEAEVAPGVIVGLAVGGFDILLGAIDGYRAKLKERAVRTYNATAIVPGIELGGNANRPQCIVTERYIGDNKKPSMVLVNVLTLHKSMVPNDDTVGLAWMVAFLRVDQAAAQTAQVEGKDPTIRLTQSIAIAAIQPNRAPGSTGETMELASTATFQLSGIALGKGYINHGLLPKDAAPAKDLEKLTVAPGPLFARLRKSPAVGSVNVTVTERGSAADLDDASAAEKALRAAIRSAIGAELEARLSED